MEIKKRADLMWKHTGLDQMGRGWQVRGDVSKDLWMETEKNMD